MTENTNFKPLTMSVETTRQTLDIGATKLWELIGTREIETIRIGRKRLVLVDSLHAYVERRRDAEPGSS